MKGSTLTTGVFAFLSVSYCVSAGERSSSTMTVRDLLHTTIAAKATRGLQVQGMERWSDSQRRLIIRERRRQLQDADSNPGGLTQLDINSWALNLVADGNGFCPCGGTLYNLNLAIVGAVKEVEQSKCLRVLARRTVLVSQELRVTRKGRRLLRRLRLL